MEPNKLSASKASQPNLRELKSPSISPPPQLRSETGRTPDESHENKASKVDVCPILALEDDEDEEIKEVIRDLKNLGLVVPARRSFTAPTLSSTTKSRPHSGKSRTTQSKIIDLTSQSPKIKINKEDRFRMDREQKRKRERSVPFESYVSGPSAPRPKKKKTPRDLMFRELIYLDTEKLWGDRQGIIIAFMEIYDRNH